MFNKMIAQQTAKKEKLLDNFLKKHEAEYPFPEDVELICDIDYMGDGDGEHIYMTGTSAGASLCVYLAAMLKSPELAKAFQVVPNDLKIRALGLASGMYSKKLSETCHRHFWSQLMEILFEITADSMQKR